MGFGEVDGFDELVEGGVDAGGFGGLDVAGEDVDGLGEGLKGLAGGGFSGGEGNSFLLFYLLVCRCKYP